MRARNCKHCEALWRVYEDSLAEQMAAMDIQYRAMLDGDHGNDSEMQIHHADRRRADVRKRIVEHYWAAHRGRQQADAAAPQAAKRHDENLMMAG